MNRAVFLLCLLGISMVSAIENDDSQCSAEGSCPDPTTLLQAGVKVNHEEKEASLEEESSKGLVDAAVQEGSGEDSEEDEEDEADGNSEDEKEAEDEEEETGEGLEEETGEASDENTDNRALLNFREEDAEDSAASRRRTPYGVGFCSMEKCQQTGGSANYYVSTKCISARRRGWPGKYAQDSSKARCQGGHVPCGHFKCGIVSKITIEYCCYPPNNAPRRRTYNPSTPRRRSSSSPRRRSSSTPRRRQGTNEHRRRRFCSASYDPIKTTSNKDPWCCENPTNAWCNRRRTKLSGYRRRSGMACCACELNPPECN